MKKVLLTLSAIATLGFAANAQTEKGQFLLGGQVSYEGTSVKDSDDKSNSFSILPTVGYFVADNIAVGTAIGYGWSEVERAEDLKTTQSTFQLAPFGRMYSNNHGPVKF
ncbi:MAG: porin family protein, partial [Sphingobacterium sp.]